MKKESRRDCTKWETTENRDGDKKREKRNIETRVEEKGPDGVIEGRMMEGKLRPAARGGGGGGK